MHYVTIAKTCKKIVPVPDDLATNASQAISLVTKEYVDNSTSALSCDSDWDTVNVCFDSFTDYTTDQNGIL